MQYSWSWGAFAVGFIILIASILLMANANKVSSMFGGAISKYQLYSYIGCGIGLFVMFNLHSLIISFLAGSVFGGLKSK